jgi:hypothetical protein
MMMMILEARAAEVSCSSPPPGKATKKALKPASPAFSSLPLFFSSDSSLSLLSPHLRSKGLWILCFVCLSCSSSLLLCCLQPLFFSRLFPITFLALPLIISLYPCFPSYIFSSLAKNMKFLH